jgi:branched-chain amino acid transport system permease protein
MASILAQFLNGLASASTLFLIAVGLSLIFGVTRIVNFAHGSLYMLGIYTAYSAVNAFAGAGPIGFWTGMLAAALAVGVLGALIEILVLRRIYQAPELFQLLATFALVLIIKDFALWVWGAEDLLGPRAAGLDGAVSIAGWRFPQYDLFLIAVGPLVLGLLWLVLHRTRWGTLVRAATQDREMVGALGVNQKLLFTSVFALGAFLAGLGGALEVPREPAQLFLDISAISDAFVIVVVGGMGSISGAFLAALIIGEVKAFCIGIGTVGILGFDVSFSKLTLVIEFIVMAVVLVIRPWGLLGRPQAAQRAAPSHIEPPLRPAPRGLALGAVVLLAALAALPAYGTAYNVVLMIDILVFALFAASLHLLMGPAGMVSFGHAAYFGLGAYGAGLLLLRAGFPMQAALVAAPFVAAIGAALFGWFCVRLSGVYLAMLTLAFAQIAWSVVFQWDSFTGGSNGMIGIWPAAWASSKAVYYLITLGLCATGVLAMRRIVFAPFGFALRAGRDSPLRCDAIGIDLQRMQWGAFTLAGMFAGIAGALYAFSKGSVSPEVMSISRSVDGLVMVLLGGVQTLSGPVVGAAAFTWLQDTIARNTEYWQSLLGATILAIVLAFPRGIVGFVGSRFERREEPE